MLPDVFRVSCNDARFKTLSIWLVYGWISTHLWEAYCNKSGVTVGANTRCQSDWWNSFGFETLDDTNCTDNTSAVSCWCCCSLVAQQSYTNNWLNNKPNKRSREHTESHGCINCWLHLSALNSQTFQVLNGNSGEWKTNITSNIMRFSDSCQLHLSVFRSLRSVNDCLPAPVLCYWHCCCNKLSVCQLNWIKSTRVDLSILILV